MFQHRIRRALFATLLMIFTVTLKAPTAHAWGKRGHSLVCETAAYLLASRPEAAFLKEHSFDLGYYCNVPDLVWKGPATYDDEWYNHFMDMEIFEREFKAANADAGKAFEMDRLAFNSAYPAINNSAGRSWWRIRELLAEMDKISTELKNKDLAKDKRHELQADWLVHAGAVGHYVGDLAQPLHVTENYDGQLSEQKGVHAFFEEAVVNELFLPTGAAAAKDGKTPALEGEVSKLAQKKQAALDKAAAKKKAAPAEPLAPIAILQKLSGDSNKQAPELLKIDKKIGRDDVAKAAAAYRTMVTERMADGAVALADLWSRSLGFEFDEKRFYTFRGAPAFIPPPKPAPTPAPTPTPSASPTTKAP